MQEWHELVGAFVLNFGAAEMTTHVWIRKLSTEINIRDKALSMTLSERISLVNSLVRDSDLPPDIKTRSLELWQQVSKLSKRRNEIAHSPLARPKNSEDGWGILDVKKMKGIGPFTITRLEFRDVARDGKRLAKVLPHLLELFCGDDSKEKVIRHVSNC